MSSDSSISSTSSRLRQFGLYRTIDARTEEFLRLSRKRQLRQGCACAAVSTAITVTVVVVILLIYEYAIAVEWSIVQRRRGVNGTNGLNNITGDNPHADKLDRSYFGFDQDYFERMPLLVNALQESNYVDPAIEMSRPVSKRPFGKSLTTTSKPTYATNNYKQNIRRTSPRPFYFEYRGATPLPFSKTYGSRSWVDNYRNAQRLQNIRQVIKYLEKTINAKSADMNVKSTTHKSIAFSGVYVEPTLDKINSKEEYDTDNVQQNSDKIESFINHQEDPLFKFKPDSPGEVNLLADTMLRFSPIPTPSILDDSPAKVPMFKKIPSYKKHCTGPRCNDNIDNTILRLLQSSSSTEYTTENIPTTKSFSVMLNLYPVKPNITNEQKRYEIKRRPSIDKIYLTTSKPMIHFRKKTIPTRRPYYRYKKPRYLIRKEERETTVTESTTPTPEIIKSTTPLIVHVNVYSPEEKTTEAMRKNDDIKETTTKQMEPVTYPPINDIPILTADQVEDHHDGSSGLLYINPVTEPPPPRETTMPFFEVVSSSSEDSRWVTNPPEVVKFSAEDAKIPDHYLSMETTQSIPTEMTRRFSYENSEEGKGETYEEYHEPMEPLVIKLRNNIRHETIETTTVTSTTAVTAEVTEETSEVSDEPTEVSVENTTAPTYVPQINGHYRSLHTSSNAVNETNSNKRRRIEMSVTGFRTYVPMYVEIKRNSSRQVNDDEYDDSESE